MRLFDRNEFQVYPTPEALMIPEIRAIIETYGEEEGLLYLAYIEFKHSYLDTNPYAGYEDEVKAGMIKKDLFDSKGIKFKITEALRFAETKYISFRDEASPTLRYYLSSLKTAERLRVFLETVDLSERTKSGGPVFKPQDISRSLKDTNEIVENLYKLKKKVQQETIDRAKKKGEREINRFEE